MAQTKGAQTKEARIAAQKKKLLEKYSALPPGQMELASSLIDRAAFLTVTLADLEAEINKTGVIDVYNHGGGQKGRKRSAEADLHTAYTKNLATITKQLSDMLKSAPQDVEEDDFTRF